MNMLMKDNLERLLEVTADLRGDMHEPDGGGLTARVVGNKLDNAFMERISDAAVEGGWQEFVVILERDGFIAGKFNLATLIALARKAQL